MAEGSDFDDDEDFGLGAGAAKADASAVPVATASVPQDDEEDIYGDIAEQPGLPGMLPDRIATPTVSGTDNQDAKTQHADRQNSGSLAESRAATPPNIEEGKSVSGRRVALPKKLADTTVVYVGELQWWTSDADLEAACGECGPIEAISFFEDKGSGKSKGYALVTFRTKEAANLCRQQVHGTEINGRRCVVTFSSNSSAATAAAKAGGKPESRASNPIGASGLNRGQQIRPNRAWNGQDMGMPLPPMPPWPNRPMMGMGMALPMPGMGMPHFMGMNGGAEGLRDFKRQRF